MGTPPAFSDLVPAKCECKESLPGLPALNTADPTVANGSKHHRGCIGIDNVDKNVKKSGKPRRGIKKAACGTEEHDRIFPLPSLFCYFPFSLFQSNAGPGIFDLFTPVVIGYPSG
jgi:hypothetical protein